MINVEGDYKEIVQWLDETKFYHAVSHVQSHYGVCYGLFTVVNSVISEKGRWVMDFNKRYVEGYKILSRDELANSHKLRF